MFAIPTPIQRIRVFGLEDNKTVFPLLRILVRAMKSIIFWGLATCNPVEIYRSFEEICCFHLQGRKVSHFLLATINLYLTTGCYIPENSNYNSVNLESILFKIYI
jgi:hypothetical protein